MYKTFESIQTNGTAKVIAAAAIQTFFVKLSRVIFFEKGHFYSKRLKGPRAGFGSEAT